MAIALKTAQAFGDTRTKFFLTFSVTDSATSNPTFYWGDAHFYSSNVHGGPPVTPVVADWGDFPEVMPSGASSNEAPASVWLFANETAIPTNGTTEKKVSEWLRILQLRGVKIEAYFWNELDTTQERFWTGYVAGIGKTEFRDGVAQIQVLLSGALPATESTPISDMVDKDAFTAAPQDSVGLMIPRVYGQCDDGVAAGISEKGFYGFPTPGFEGIVVDENQATAQLKIRFAKNDGTGAWDKFTEHSGSHPNSTIGDLWIYDPSMNAYGLVDGASYSVTNSSSFLEVVVERSPKVWFFVRPSQVNTTLNDAGFTSLHRLVNSDATDYQESDGAGNDQFAFFTPAISINGTVEEIRVVLDVLNAAAGNRSIRWGVFAGLTSNWYNNKYDEYTLGGVGGRTQIMGDDGAVVTTAGPGGRGRYVRADFGGTEPDFSAGQFLNVSAGAAQPATMLVQVFSASKDGVRLYGMTLCVKVAYPYVPLGNINTWWTPARISQYQQDAEDKRKHGGDYEFIERWIERGREPRTAEERRKDSLRRLRGTMFFARGRGQEDDGSGTYSGTASAPITRVVDIANHLIHKVGGKARNVTAGTLGNFIDPRTNGIIGDIDVLARFGTDRYDLEDCLGVLAGRFPVKFIEEEGTWHCIPDDTNPHSSRFYRSTAEIVDIEAADIEFESFQSSEVRIDDIANKVTFAYGHGFPDREPGRSYVYNNNLSQQFFGTRPDRPREEPWIRAGLLDADNPNAIKMAKWYGQRAAWPYLRVAFRTRQKLYDLKRGHVVRLRGIEDRGIPFTAYRGGLLMQHFLSSSSSGSVHDGGSLIGGSGTSETYFCTRHQIGQLDFDVAVAAGYTNVANPWEYLNVSQAWTTLANVVNPHGLKSTGKQTISWDRPNPWDHAKNETSINGVTRGPGYWYRFKWSIGTATGSTASRTTYPASWYDPLFVVLDATKIPPANSRSYPKIQVQLMEVY